MENELSKDYNATKRDSSGSKRGSSGGSKRNSSGGNVKKVGTRKWLDKKLKSK